MWYRYTIWAALGLVGSGVQPPQQVRLVGRVFDEAHRPVDAVEVIVNRQEVRAMTDGAGVFKLDVSRRDSTVGFRRIGYRPMLFTIQPPPPRDTILVRLVTSPVHLPEVIISASPSKPLRYAGTTKYDEVFVRQKVGLGTLITREAIDTRFGVATYELLDGIQGIRTWNGPPKRIRFPRCQEPGGVTVFVDGVRQIPASSSQRGDARRRPSGSIMPSRGSSTNAPSGFALDEEPEIEMLSRVNPSDIEMIEVFRGAGEIPGVFHWNGCAVVAIWTRWNR